MIFSESGIQIGLFNFSYYGLVIVLSIILSFILAHRRIKIRNLDAHLLWPLAVVILISSIFGARLWYTTFPPPSAIRLGLTAEFYRSSILDFFAFWQGGFAMPGAILGSVFGFLIFSWRNKLPIISWMRATVIVIPFAASIILWGNFLLIKTMACLLLFPGQFKSHHHTACRVILLSPLITPYFYISHYGH